MNKTIPISLLLASAAAMPAADASATLNGVWKSHPALDIDSRTQKSATANNVVKILDTEKYCYFQISGKLHDTDGGGWEFQEYVTFPGILDKTRTDAKVEPLAYHHNLSGDAVKVMEYSPKGRYLVLAYENRKIDVIFDSGEMFSLDAANFNTPGDMTPRSISFDLSQENFYVATACGYVAVNVAERKVTEMRNLGVKLNVAAKVGERMLLGTADALYNLDAGNLPKNLSGETPLHPNTGTSAYLLKNGNLGYPYMIYPTAEDEFIYISTHLATTGTTSRGLSGNVVTLDSEDTTACELTNLFTGALNVLQMGLNAKYSYDPDYYGLVSPYAEGITVSTTSNFYKIKLDCGKIDRSTAAAVSEYKAAVLTTIGKDTSATTLVDKEQYKRHGSWDGADYIFFYPRQGFKRRRIEGASGWSAPGELIEVQANSAIDPAFMTAHPEYGLLVRNWGFNIDHNEHYAQSDGLSALSQDGVWTNFSLTHHAYANSQVIRCPYGLSYDPQEPDYIYGVGYEDGILRQNLKEPDKFTYFVSKAYTRSKAETRINIVDATTGTWWNNFMAFTAPIFDEDGTMWTMYPSLVSNQDPELHAELWYWEAADRLGVNTQEDYDAHPMRKIRIPGVDCHWTGRLIKGKTEGNRNTFGYSFNWYDMHAVMFDHNGTPEDISDDRVVKLDRLIDDSGDLMVDSGRVEYIFEDPYDGRFILSSDGGLLCASHQDIFDNEVPHVARLHPEYADGVYPGQWIGMHGDVTGIDSDKWGRKWIVTNYDGVYCLSEDRSQVLAHFTSVNSPLPAEALISGVMCDPYTGAVNVATSRGFYQFYPEGTATAFEAGKVTILPRVVDAEYKGYVRVSGLADGEEYVIEDAEGNDVAILNARAGRAEWHPQGVAAGVYRLRGVKDGEIIINQ